MSKVVIAHKIYVRHSGVEAADRLQVPLIKRCVRTTLRCEGVGTPCEVSVLITDDSGIRALNRQFRDRDEPTDVLSFPMQNITEPGQVSPDAGAVDQETGLLPLGDIIISAGRVEKQARKYHQTRERETAYLTVHSVLHLLGYDHPDEAQGKRLMRAREEEIMQEININC